MEAITLDGYWESIENPPLHFIKIDIEEAEDLAIEGARKVLNRWRPYVCVEVHSPNDEKPSCTLQTLQELDYKIFSIDFDPWRKVENTARGHVLGIP